MTKYEAVLQEAAGKGLTVAEDVPFASDVDGLVIGDVIGLSRRLLSYKEKACVLAEEIAHYDINVGDILDPSDSRNSQQEHRARMRWKWWNKKRVDWRDFYDVSVYDTER